MKSPHFGCFVLLASLIGCSGNPAPEGGEPSGSAGSPVSAGSAGAPAANGGSGTAEAGAGPSNTAGTTAGGAPAGGGGTAPSAGSNNGGASSGGASAGSAGAPRGGSGGASGGGATVDPSTLPNTTLHLAGDSTVAKYTGDIAQEGWGQELQQFFNSKLTLDNQAIGGASVETFYTGRWKNIMNTLKAGDYVIGAFGANDSGSVEGRHVEPAAFQARFEVMAQEVMAKQATFIACTPSALQEWSGGKNTNNRLGPYVTVLHTFSESKNIKLADLNARSLELLNQIGQEAAKEIYINGDKAHFTKKGATQMAEFVSTELKRIGSPLGAYVK